MLCTIINNAYSRVLTLHYILASLNTRPSSLNYEKLRHVIEPRGLSIARKDGISLCRAPAPINGSIGRGKWYIHRSRRLSMREEGVRRRRMACVWRRYKRSPRQWKYTHTSCVSNRRIPSGYDYRLLRNVVTNVTWVWPADSKHTAVDRWLFSKKRKLLGSRGLGSQSGTN